MTRDPFSSAAIASAVAESRQLQTIARPIALADRRNTIENHGARATTREVMSTDVCDAARVPQPGDSVQRRNVRSCTPEKYRPGTEEQARALRAIRGVPAPLTSLRVARALQWSRGQASYYLNLFHAKGVLGSTGRAYFWRETA
jgi:hypothetical protein